MASKKDFIFLSFRYLPHRAFGQFTNITMNETTVLCLTVQNAKYPITLVRFKSIVLYLMKSDLIFSLGCHSQHFFNHWATATYLHFT